MRDVISELPPDRTRADVTEIMYIIQVFFMYLIGCFYENRINMQLALD